MDLDFSKSWVTVGRDDDEAKDAVLRALQQHANQTRQSLDVTLYYMEAWRFITWKPAKPVLNVREETKW